MRSGCSSERRIRLEKPSPYARVLNELCRFVAVHRLSYGLQTLTNDGQAFPGQWGGLWGNGAQQCPSFREAECHGQSAPRQCRWKIQQRSFSSRQASTGARRPRRAGADAGFARNLTDTSAMSPDGLRRRRFKGRRSPIPTRACRLSSRER